jgi:tight adherence protein B
MDLTTLLLAAGLGFLMVMGLGFVFLSGDSGQQKVSKRLQTIAASGPADRGRLSKNAPDAPGVRRKQILQTLKAAEKQERKLKLTLESRLRQAGLSFSLRAFWIGSGILGVVVFVAAVVISRNPLIGFFAAFAGGLGLPRWVLGVLSKRRIKKFTEDFPNATDIIVRGIKAGLPVSDCLKIISRESPEPMGSEFRQVVEASAMGVSMDRALEKMYEHMPTSEVRFFSIVLNIQSKTGGNLAEALNNLSTVLRARKLMVEKIKALSSEAVASAVIIGCLPPGVMMLIYFTAPTYMSAMFTDKRGHVMLIGSALWMGTGIFVMRRMINFKF